MRVIFTPLAERQIDSLHACIAAHSSERLADHYVGRIVGFCRGLTTFPCAESSATTCWPGCARSKPPAAGALFAICTSADTTPRGICGMYMAGFSAGMNIEQILPHKACLPKGITGIQVKTVFEGFMRDYPKLQEASGVDSSIIVGLALFRAYPCSTKRQQQPELNSGDPPPVSFVRSNVREQRHLDRAAIVSAIV